MTNSRTRSKSLPDALEDDLTRQLFKVGKQLDLTKDLPMTSQKRQSERGTQRRRSLATPKQLKIKKEILDNDIEGNSNIMNQRTSAQSTPHSSQLVAEATLNGTTPRRSTRVKKATNFLGIT